MQPIKQVNGINIFDQNGTFMLKKGWATIGNYFTQSEAIAAAKKANR